MATKGTSGSATKGTSGSATKGKPGKASRPVRSFIVHTWRIGPGTLCGGVKESRSSRWGSWADAESSRDTSVELNGGPGKCGSEILPSTRAPELVRHCSGHPAQAIGCTCFGCGRIVPDDCQYVYGLFLAAEHSPDNREKWALTRDAQLAEQRARMPGWTVRRMSEGAYSGDTGAGSWDAPTFYGLSDPLPM